MVGRIFLEKARTNPPGLSQFFLTYGKSKARWCAAHLMETRWTVTTPPRDGLPPCVQAIFVIRFVFHRFQYYSPSLFFDFLDCTLKISTITDPPRTARAFDRSTFVVFQNVIARITSFCCLINATVNWHFISRCCTRSVTKFVKLNFSDRSWQSKRRLIFIQNCFRSITKCETYRNPINILVLRINILKV